MKNFLKYTLATIVGFTLTQIIGFLVFMAIIGAIVGSAEDKVVDIKPNSVLKITLDNPVTERTSKNPFENINWMNMQSEQKLGLNDILKNLKNAAKDENIKGIYLEVDAVPAGIATIQEIREALLKFKESGKFIIAYSDMYSQTAYYMVSVADKIYMNPEGLLELKGLGAEMMFFKNALAKLGVEPQIIRHGKFKSAVEPFMLEKMSDANREQTMTYLQSIWDHILDGISNSRGISVSDLNMYADSMKITNAQAAVDYKLLDGTKYKDEIISELKELSGTANDKDIEFISLSKYTNAPEIKDYKGLAKDKIAVIYGTGQIDMGDGSTETIGSEGLSKAIREARKDSSIKAIVLRVNSPGGSALASEVIWREMTLAKKVKPVIVSMGDVAASGGYYISAPADVILANENTITGSIGVFGVLWNGQELLNEKLGVTIDVAKTNAHSDIGSVYRKMTNSERSVIQHEVENVYDVFIGHVAEGRKMTKAEVDSIGQGRVWSGKNAMDIGLIDKCGGISEAIEIAKEKAGLENFRVVELPKLEDPIEQMLKEFTGEAEASVLKKNLGESYIYYKRLQNLTKMKGIQARLPFEVDIY
ncbi:MAG: signal peptide peptidase SppA [Marinilabiliales bacterium]|nr:MAG: signal peptide peptidase SppA [Marinilabiliales bacterium]